MLGNEQRSASGKGIYLIGEQDSCTPCFWHYITLPMRKLAYRKRDPEKKEAKSVPDLGHLFCGGFI